MSNAAFDDMISILRKLGGEEFVNEVAKEAAPLLNDAVKATARAGTSPDGTPWAPRKKDGAPALAGADKDVTTAAHGPIVRMTLTGGPVYAQVGARGPKRGVIPSGGAQIPAVASDAILEAARRVFDRITGGR